MREIHRGRVEAQGRWFDYYLLEELPLRSAWGSYGVKISGSDGETGAVRGITVSQAAAARLVGLLMRCQVTPVSLRDVLDDLVLLECANCQ